MIPGFCCPGPVPCACAGLNRDEVGLPSPSCPRLAQGNRGRSQNRLKNDAVAARIDAATISMRGFVTSSSNSFGYDRASNTNRSEDRDAAKSAVSHASREDTRASLRRNLLQRCSDRNGGVGLFHCSVVGEILLLVRRLIRTSRADADAAQKFPPLTTKSATVITISTQLEAEIVASNGDGGRTRSRWR